MYIERDKESIEEIEQYLRANDIEHEKKKVADNLYHINVKELSQKQIEDIREIANSPKQVMIIKHQAADEKVLTPGKAMAIYCAPEGEPTEEEEVEI